ncbi:amino acid--tRNA ligase-related protein [Halobacteriovorax sp. HLS]|uniref:amino acid--tRNA ligase-related protein n=1 Tax=Halobacteriovorax sp. HLS TaxID=2234000 RepID=UPI000FD8DB04|nr:amino acid--tRNA ligase-related protein [Halobacteriovorax sp. HLS]
MHTQARKNKLLNLFKLQQYIRDFFLSEEFLDVLTPPMVENPGMETHIHPFRVHSARDKKNLDKYLHTSPEFHMKELLSEGFEKVFTISYCFRDEPNSTHHRAQFLMLEWYRTESFYTDIMSDVENLVKYCAQRFSKENPLIKNTLKNFTPIRMTIQELFLQELGIDILKYLDKDDLSTLIRTKFKNVPVPSEKEHHLLSWDDYYFLLFLNEVEPRLKNIPFILLYEFPHHLSALSTIKENEPRVCERFEVYCHGVELCNCFNELTDLAIQKQRFSEQAALKKELYDYSLPTPNEFYSTLDKGLPKASGIALGVERLLMAITQEENPFYF